MARWSRSLVMALVFACWLVTSLHAQSASPQIRVFPPSSYEIADMATSPQNYACVRTPLGHLFLANSDVLLGFDGKRWQQVVGSAHRSFLKLALDAQGRLYTGGIGDLGWVSADSLGRPVFRSLLDKVPSEAQPLSQVVNVACDAAGRMHFLDKNWLLTWDGHTMQAWPSASGFKKLFIVDGQPIVQTRGDGLYRQQGACLDWIAHTEVFDSLVVKGLHSSGNSGQFFVVTHRHGLMHWDGLHLRPIPSALDSMVVWNSLLLPDGKLALATERHGACIFDLSNLQIETVTEADGLYFNATLQPSTDDENGLWIASNIGFNRIEYPSHLRRLVPPTRSKIMTMAMREVRGRLIVGNVDGCLIATPANGRYQIRRMPHANDLTRSIIEEDGTILIGVTGDGIYALQNEELQRILAIRVLHLHSSTAIRGRVWIGLETGVAAMQRTAQGWQGLPPIPGISHPVTDIVEMPDGSLWCAGRQVSHVQFPQGLNASPVVTTCDSAQGFTPDHVEYDLWLHGGKLYFGTARGLFSFDEQQRKLLPDSTFGLRFADSGNAAHFMVEDLQGNIWLYDGTHAGVLRQQPNGTWTWDDLPLRSMENQTVWTIYPAPDSLIWIGTTTDLYSLDPRIPKDYHVPFFTHIDRVVVGDTTLVFAGYYADAAQNIVQKQPSSYIPTFTFAQNDIAFSYAATSYELPERTVFSHWLEGLEEGWSPWLAASDKAYNDLPAGHYTFHVKSRNLYDTEGEEAAYSFEILPPWYQTIWAYLLYAGIAAAVVGLIVRWQVGRANRRQELKRGQERAQQRAILQAAVDTQEKERARIARDLHDDIQVTLSTVKLKLGMASRDLHKQGLLAPYHDETASLVLEAIQRIREISQGLMPAALQRFGLAQALQENCEKIGSADGLRVIFAVEGTAQRLGAEVELAVFRIAQELLTNSLKHAQATEIQVRLSFLFDELVLHHRDNGSGFSGAEASLMKGMGFRNMEGRISLVGGTMRWESSLGNGAQFWVHVPR